MISGEDIIIFSSDDWNSGLKTSKYHVAVRLARANRVLFVNSIGLRSPNLSSRKDLGRMWEKLARFFRGAAKVQDNLWVFTPLIIPFQRWALIRGLNRLILRASLRAVMAGLRMKTPIVFMFSQNMTALLGRLGEKQAVYYCIDELTGYREVDKEALAAMERELLAKADCVITCSEELTESKRPFNKHAYYVPHGVDWALFSRTARGEVKVPADIADLPKPVIGFYGFLSDDWIDFTLLKDMARAHPDWSIVLIGRSKSDLTQILPEANIHFLGVRPFEQLPDYSAGFDVGIIPFAINELTRHSNPLKLLEYLSAGLPVVSVDIPEVRRFRDWIAVADGREDFIRKVEQALAEDTPQLRQARSARMAAETWDQRLNAISNILSAHRRAC